MTKFETYQDFAVGFMLANALPCGKPEMYTEAFWRPRVEQFYQLSEKISRKVLALVNKTLEGVDEEVDRAVRDKLTDEFRFWK